MILQINKYLRRDLVLTFSRGGIVEPRNEFKIINK